MASLTYGSVIGGGPGYTTVDTPTGPMTVVGDRATRNNNPGNIEAGSYADSQGAIGTDGRFAVFGSRLTGTRAQAGLIFGSRYANLTLRDAIAKYAPSFENNSAAYAAAVAAAAGVSLDTKMKDIPADKQAAVVAGMQTVEGNTSAKVYDSQGNLVGTIDPTSPRTPNTAPAPYGPDSSQAVASTRPDNQNYTGPKGLFSVDTGVASPIGHVARSPLGPATPSFGGIAAPSRPDNANYAIGKSSLGPAAPSVSSKSPDRPDNHAYSGPVGMGGVGGNYVDAASAAAATAATHAAASAARQAAASPAASAAPSAAPSPSRPDNLGGLNYGSPKGVFSVDPGAVVSGIAPSLGPVAPSAPVAAPARPAIAPVPAAAVPKPAVQVAAVAPPTPSYSPSQAVAPARPSLSAADVYGGAVGTAQTTTPGTTVSRTTSYGPTYTTNKFGAVTATAPDGTQMAAWGGVPAPGIAGPINNTGIAAPSTGIGGMFGPKAKSATGTIAGAAIGGYALGPLGAMLGGLIGKNVAQGKAPLSGILGSSGNAIGTHVVDTFQGPMSFANAQGGLGFPSAPANPGGYTATSSNNSAAGMRGISPGAANAIDHGYAGLY